uniref:F-box domain-containing protein n=1 Tax=Meloidogyne hapla TaxID=6305 RepID=A0A1I8B1Z8_MELHA
MYYLPVEAKLDIFKFLNINQITKLQQTNQHFFKLINKYQKELPRQKIYSIKITRGECYGNLINPESGVFKFKLRDELNEEDCSRIALNDSLFTQHGVPLCYSYNKMKRVVILIKMKECQNRLFHSKDKVVRSGDRVVIKIELCNDCVKENCNATDLLSNKRKKIEKRN